MNKKNTWIYFGIILISKIQLELFLIDPTWDVNEC